MRYGFPSWKEKLIGQTITILSRRATPLVSNSCEGEYLMTPEEAPLELTQALPVISPNGMMPVQVIRREIAAPGVVTLFIVLPGTNQAPAPYLPGQFVTLALPTSRETLYRSYSLCSSGDPEQPWEITIKRLKQGAVSTYMYDLVRENTLLYASLPRGSFTMPERWSIRTPFVFVAVGSGITPVIGMLRFLAALPFNKRPRVQLHYASRTEEDIIYRDELDQIDPDEDWLRQYHYLSSENNRLTPEAVVDRAGSSAPLAHWYMCGPIALKRDLQDLLEDIGVPDEQVHSEVFASEVRKPAASVGQVWTVGEGTAPAGGGFAGPQVARLTVSDTGDALDVRAGETILATLERNGYRPNTSCRAGSCGTCRLQLLSGQASPAGEALSKSERAAGYVLSCIAVPQGDVTIASGGRPPAGRPRVPMTAGAGGAPAFAGSSRSVQRVLVRMATVAAVGGLAIGAWHLTNHFPLSLETVNAANNSGQTTPPASPTAGATPSHSGGGKGSAKPTATPTLAPGQPSPTPVPPTATPKPGQPPPPTATPAPPPPTATPAPKATATPTPHS
jgi:ferredoxin-NADP reductase